MAIIADYLKQAAAFLIFSGIAAACAPERFKKMIAFCAGLAFVLIAIKPIAFAISPAFTDGMGGVMSAMSESGDIPVFAEDDALTGEVISRYSDALGEYMRNIVDGISAETGLVFDGADFDADGDPSSPTFGQLNAATVYVREKGDERRGFIYVEPIRIKDNLPYSAAAEREGVNAIKKLISDFYNLAYDNINVVVR